MENQPAPPVVMPLTCPTCHQIVEGTDYFCPNCGKNLKPAPPSTTLTSQMELYGKSLLLPPLGFLWGYKYLKQPGMKAKMVGLTTMIITVVVLVFIVVSTVKLINTVNEQVNSQLNQMVF